MTDVLRLNSIQIREIADYAQSVRAPDGQPVFFKASYSDALGFQIAVESDMLPCADATTVPVPAATFTLQPHRLPVEMVAIQAQGMTVPEPLDQYDSVFWSESAVEKFLFPYYASKGQWAAAHVLTVLSNVFYGFVPVPASTAQPLDAGEIPFAVAHIPRSDYAVLDPPPGHSVLGHDLAILFRDGQGNVKHRLLAEFL